MMSYAKLSAIGLTGLLVVSVGLIVLTQPPTYGPLPVPGTYSNNSYYGSAAYGGYVPVPPPASCGEWARFASEQDLRDAVNNSYGIYYLGGGPVPPMADRMVTNELSGAPGGDGSGAPQTPDYSGTNVQTAGIDEPDIVKTDGWYIYTVSGGQVSITLAYPPSQARLVSTISDPHQYAYGLFVLGDRLVVLSSLYDNTYGYGSDVRVDMAFAPYYGSPRTAIMIYDISDVQHPQLATNVTVTGYSTGARMIGSEVFLVAQHYIYLDQDNELVLPAMWVDGQMDALSATDIGYFPDAHNTSSVTTVTVLNLTKPAEATFTALLTSAGSQLYVSKNSIYLVGYGSSFATLWRGWADVSTIHRLFVYQGTVACAVTGEVNGHVLNQFAMDEYGGHFRIATTEWASNGTATTQNHVFVLNGTLDVVGQINGMAPGEMIQAVRFLGERAYVVTFEQIDPFFVVDLSVPTAPRVLGELKITGFSQYLHPISDSLVIGIGVETSAPDGSGRVTRQGFKVSVFDVADVSNPREVSKDVVEGLSVYSEAQWDAHAFLWIASRGLLVLPMQVYEGSWETGQTSYWQGVYVWHISNEGAVERVGTVAHGSQQSTSSGAYYGYYAVRRSLYIGDYLYTVSETTIQVNDLATLAHVTSVTIWSPPVYNDWWSWLSGGGPVSSGTAESPPPM